jgi:hypothetical protein
MEGLRVSVDRTHPPTHRFIGGTNVPEIYCKPLPEFSERDIARFWSKVDRSAGPDACWPWTAGRLKSAYGHFGKSIKNRTHSFRSHRVALYLATGKDPYPLDTLHSCDNPPCCNPDHLSAGTKLQNMQEMVERKRSSFLKENRPNYSFRAARGNELPHTKLNPRSVHEIRILHSLCGYTCREVAQRFSVTHQAVSDIVLGKTWAWVR